MCLKSYTLRLLFRKEIGIFPVLGEEIEFLVTYYTAVL
jgi:hypothetical protein